MGELTRAFDWANSPLGSPEGWPLPLRTTVSLLLSSKFPMLLWWGPELIQFYNDAYRPSLGNEGKHPTALGQRGQDCWPEIWPTIKPFIDQVLAGGEAVWRENQLLPIYRNGRLEDVYWTFSYGAVPGESGRIDGVLVVCQETTGAVLAQQRLAVSEARFRSIVEQAPLAIGLLRGRDMFIEAGNDRIFEVWGKDSSITGMRLIEALPEIKGQGFVELLEGVYDSGEPHFGKDVQAKLMRQGRLEENYFDFVYTPLRDAFGAVTGVMVLATEVTQQVIVRKALEASEARFRSLIEEAPVGTCLFVGRGMRIEVANDIILGYWGKDQSVIGKLLREAVPELEGQPFFELLDEVFTTGKTYVAKAARAELNVGGVLGTYYFAYTYKPLRNAKGDVYAVMNMALDVTEQVISGRKIQESEAYFRQLTDTVPAIIWETTADGYCTYLNQQWYDATGQTQAEAEGDGWRNATHPDDKAEAGRLFVEANEKQTPFNVLYRLRRKDGSYRWAIDKGSPRRGLDGEYEGMIGTVVDVHDQTLARQALEVSEAKLRSVIATAPAAMGLFVGRDLVVEMPNQTFIDIVGKGPDIVGKPLREVMPELESQSFLQILDEVYTSGQMFQSFAAQVNIVQHGVMTHNFYNITYTPLLDGNGAVYAILDIATDVTEAVKSRQKIELERQRFYTVLETTPNMTWTNTPQGEVSFYNRCWYDYTELNFEQTRGWGWQDVVHPDDLLRTLTNYKRALASGGDFMVENRYRRADGQYRWHLSRALPLRDETGQITLWVGTATDIHEQKQLEAELEQQVGQRTQQLQVSVQDLQRSNESLQQFAYIASHDLQEPLRKIQSFGDILRNKYADQLGGGVDHLQRMQAAANRMSTLIRDLLAFSRIATQLHTRTAVPLTPVVVTALHDLELVLEETGAVVDVEPLPTVQGDASQLGQLFQNLLSNALKFRPPGTVPTVQVRTRWVDAAELPPAVRPIRVAPAYHRIDVTDNGIGFEEKYVDRIFQVFQRLHGRGEFAGTGIGLAICEKVAANHGGTITASSQPGQGSTFSVYLPVSEK